MDNPEKLESTEDEDKQNKNTNTICVVHYFMQSNTNNVNKTYPFSAYHNYSCGSNPTHGDVYSIQLYGI